MPSGLQGYDRYAYSKNNPVKYIDPSGHKACDDEYDCQNTPTNSISNALKKTDQKKPKDDEPNCGQHGIYSPKCSGWHFYTTTNIVCPAQLHCTLEEMKGYLLRFAYPGQDPSKPVVSGNYYNVTDPWAGILPKSIGPIVTYISSDRLTISNVTRPGHILYDGRIDRTISQMPDGSWLVTTHGYGNHVTRDVVFDAQRPDLDPIKIPVNFSGPNVWGGIPIFDKVDEQMLNYIIANH